MALWLLGDSEAVRKCLQCSELDFQDYVAGRKEPSCIEFDRLVALIVREQGILLANQREGLRQRRERKKSEDYALNERLKERRPDIGRERA